MTQHQHPKDGQSPWDSPAKRLWKKTKPSRLTKSLVGLSSAAIVSVYAVGYFNTQASENDLVAAPPASTASVAAATGTGTATPTAPTGGGSQRVAQGGATQATPQATPTSTSGSGTAAVSYKDGTYVGSGMSRHGGVQATVVVSGGKIVSADITSCGTRYPCSKIAALPPRVLATQAAPSAYVSGATDSSQAYTTAIKAALAQARLA